MRRNIIAIVALLLTCSAVSAVAVPVSGRVVDPQGTPVAGAELTLLNAGGSAVTRATTGDDGRFTLTNIDPGDYQLRAESPSFVTVIADVAVGSGQQSEIALQFQQIAAVQQQVTVVASDPSLMTPDPAQSIFIHDQVLDANPGRPGAPISIPGLPIETASGGIKAPQYFAPGVAGDHGEPIAQYFQIGDLPRPQQSSRQCSRQRLLRSECPHPADHPGRHR